MKTLPRLLALIAGVAGLCVSAAQASSVNYTQTGSNGASSDHTGIYMPTNCTITTTITIDANGGSYSGSGVAIITYNHAPYVTAHVLPLTAAHVSQTWTDYQTTDTYRVQEICSVSSPAVATVSVTFTW